VKVVGLISLVLSRFSQKGLVRLLCKKGDQLILFDAVIVPCEPDLQRPSRKLLHDDVPMV
jgi:hypothetical protein